MKGNFQVWRFQCSLLLRIFTFWRSQVEKKNDSYVSFNDSFYVADKQHNSKQKNKNTNRVLHKSRRLLPVYNVRNIIAYALHGSQKSANGIVWHLPKDFQSADFGRSKICNGRMLCKFTGKNTAPFDEKSELKKTEKGQWRLILTILHIFSLEIHFALNLAIDGAQLITFWISDNGNRNGEKLWQTFRIEFNSIATDFIFKLDWQMELRCKWRYRQVQNIFRRQRHFSNSFCVSSLNESQSISAPFYNHITFPQH